MSAADDWSSTVPQCWLNAAHRPTFGLHRNDDQLDRLSGFMSCDDRHPQAQVRGGLPPGINNANDNYFFRLPRVGLVALREAADLSMRKSSRFFPLLIAAVSHLGCAPRPAQVFPSLS
jgi:hypothetical protein